MVVGRTRRMAGVKQLRFATTQVGVSWQLLSKFEPLLRTLITDLQFASSPAGRVHCSQMSLAKSTASES